jgi:hypothetical protein
MAKKSKSEPRRGAKVPADQLTLPVTFDSNGKVVTLQELIEGKEAATALSPAALTPDQREELTIRRIKAQPEFQLAMVGAGIVDKKRAIEELKAHSDIGRILTEIEQRVIQNLLDDAVDSD